ncbi:nucleoporin complex subunit 54-domain-containing protein [Fomes fomentarius]|nr:nucleoporin complex subunit 54-domain-containing protein [Fomes fomentarius]
MSAFGFGNTQPQQQQQQQSGTAGFGAFGTTQNTTPATGGSLFGNTQPQQQQQGTNNGGGLFGASTSTQTAGTGGGLFGSTQPSGGSLFGNTNTNQQQQQGGGLFGNAGQQTTGTTAPSGGLFGATTTQPGTSTGGLFGNSATGNTGTNPFGTTQAAPSGGLFGNNTTTPNTGGGLFGNTANTGTGTTGGMFGNTTNTNTTTPGGGGLFGSTAPSTTSGMFGSTQPNASTTQQPSLFGSTTQGQNSLFGATQPQQQQQQAQSGSLFNTFGQQNKPTTGGLFGGSTLGGTGTLGGSTLLGSTFASKATTTPNAQQDAQTQFVQLAQRMEGIAQAWNPNSPQCRFQHYFYNLVDPTQAHLYGRPSNASNEQQWQKAVRENPDPSCFVPVVATGFDDLQKRVEAQTQQAAAHQDRIKDLQSRIAALTQRHQLSNASRLQRAAALQTQLTHRVLKLVQHLHLLIPALRSSALRPEEEALRTALEEIDEEVRRPGGTGRIRGKLNELWALVGAVTAARERDCKSGGVEWAVVDEAGLAQIAQVLAEEQAGLAHLTKLLQKDMKDLAVIQGSSPQEEDPDTLMSSTATLRASTL